MSSEATGETITVKTEEAGAAAPGPAPGRGEWKVRGRNSFVCTNGVFYHGRL